ncbi:MAG TPA: glucose 1-dehydrogenase [Actinopolymorphaceae bacterium]|nr:glucose 1-dehydrogenase [Actinopolymorphaceae bacterium]
MTSDGRFAGRVVLVTGAGSGIGHVLALRFAAEGAHVAVGDIDDLTAGRTCAEMERDAGGTGRAYRLDVTDRQSVLSVTADVARDLGPVDVLVNNAAVASDMRFEELTEPEWDRVVDVALKGSFLCSQAVLPQMARRHGGVIVNIGSVNAAGYFGDEAYSAAKAGLESLTRSLAVRYGASGVRVCLVAAGTVRTPAWDARLAHDPGLLDKVAALYPLGRVGDPADVAAAVLFLASDAASWITGSALRVDGGLLAGNPSTIREFFGDGYLP